MRNEIILTGNKETSLKKEIAILLNQWQEGQDPNFIQSNVIGKHAGKQVFNINGKYYKLDSKNSYTFNTEYRWILKEVTQNCYNSFYNFGLEIKTA